MKTDGAFRGFSNPRAEIGLEPVFTLESQKCFMRPAATFIAYYSNPGMK